MILINYVLFDFNINQLSTFINPIRPLFKTPMPVNIQDSRSNPLVTSCRLSQSNMSSAALYRRGLFYTNLWNFPIDYSRVIPRLFDRLGWNHGQLKNLWRSTDGRILRKIHGMITSQITKMSKIIDFLALEAMCINGAHYQSHPSTL